MEGIEIGDNVAASTTMGIDDTEDADEFCGVYPGNPFGSRCPKGEDALALNHGNTIAPAQGGDKRKYRR